MHNKTENTVSFIKAKNRVINKQLKLRSIPTLEFQALTFCTEVLVEVYQELTGIDCVNAVNIQNLVLFTDSYVALNWLQNYIQMQKLRNLSVFTINRLNRIVNLSKIVPITFKFVAGMENPSDFVTREVSEKKLIITNFITGPNFLTSAGRYNSDMIEVRVPNKTAEFCKRDMRIDSGPGLIGTDNVNNSIYESQLERFSRLKSLINSYSGQIKFINKLKQNLKNKDPIKFGHFNILDDKQIRTTVMRILIKYDQRKWYSDVLDYFESNEKSVAKKDIPSVITQLNLALDEEGVIRVKSKLYPRFQNKDKYVFPVLISPRSRLAELIVNEYHEKYDHAGRFIVLSELRKKIWIPHAFVLVKKLTKQCFWCKRMHGHTIKLNQNCYRDFRGDPTPVPFKNIFIDYLGPFDIKVSYKDKEVRKVWVLVICCLWSRAINLKLCFDLSTSEFLKSLQKQIFQLGLPSLILSDSGSQILAGAKKVNKYIFDDQLFQNFLKENNISHINFQSYPKGNHALGALIETCNRLVRKLLHGSVRRLILNISDMEFLLEKVVSLLNKRPLVLKESLRSNNDLDVPEVITPEMLVYGRPLDYLNILPELYDVDLTDLDINNIDYAKELEKLKKASDRLSEVYNDQLLQQLLIQAVNKKDRYKPQTHVKVKVGDIVLIKDDFLKPHQYPIGRVIEVILNSLNEVTEVTILKGNKEVIKRHVYAVIPLVALADETNDESEEHSLNETSDKPLRVKRKTAIESQAKIKQWSKDNLV